MRWQCLNNLAQKQRMPRAAVIGSRRESNEYNDAHRVRVPQFLEAAH